MALPHLAPLDALITAMRDMSPTTIIVVSLLLMAVECSLLVGLVIPADAVVLLGAAVLPDWPSRMALVVAVVAGSLIGETFGYAIGRVAGARIRHGRLGRRLGARKWRKAEQFLDGPGARSLVCIRFLGVVHSMAPILAGSVGMPAHRFLAWSALASSLWAVVFVVVGSTAGTTSSSGVTLVIAGSMAFAWVWVAVTAVARRARVPA